MKVAGCWIVILGLMLIGCGDSARDGDGLTAFVGATVWTGEGEAIEDAVILVRPNGLISSVGSRAEVSVPNHAEVVDLSYTYIVPGLINAHGHVGMARGLQTGPDVHSTENVLNQLDLYARYGITTVVSLGDEPPQAFDVRHGQDPANPRGARLFLSGLVIDPDSEEEARQEVRDRADQGADWTKIRVDDQLGTVEKMSEPIYAAVIDESHEHGLPHASHMVTLEDSKSLLRNGADLLAHSVRDVPIDDELIDLMLETNACITPTLTREISVFVYAERPDFFDDPFFLEHADPDVLNELQRPEVQARYIGQAADYYREALPLAMENMMRLHWAGVPVAMGTDSGPQARFQGYFEHMEMAIMQEAGMSPEEVLRSATVHAAECMRLESLGQLQPGYFADFLVLEANPLEDVHNLRAIREVYISGRPLD